MSVIHLLFKLDFLNDPAAHLTLGKASIGIDKVCGGSISLELDLKMEVSVTIPTMPLFPLA